eukprot:scaffold428514_cov33-Prasinocladus_malaysianus.AAC.1
MACASGGGARSFEVESYMYEHEILVSVQYQCKADHPDEACDSYEYEYGHQNCPSRTTSPVPVPVIPVPLVPVVH